MVCSMQKIVRACYLWVDRPGGTDPDVHCYTDHPIGWQRPSVEVLSIELSQYMPCSREPRQYPDAAVRAFRDLLQSKIPNPFQKAAFQLSKWVHNRCHPMRFLGAQGRFARFCWISRTASRTLLGRNRLSDPPQMFDHSPLFMPELL